jgi:hypothetical protein
VKVRPFTFPGRSVDGKPAATRGHVVEIKDRHTRDGVLYYKVKYSEGDGSHLHWVRASDLTCAALIKTFEQSRKAKDTTRGANSAGRPEPELDEILGIVPDQPGPVFAVRFKDSSKLQVVTQSYLHKHCARALLNYYESCVQFAVPGKEGVKAEADGGGEADLD